MRICQSLHSKLEMYSQTLKIPVAELWQDLLFEIPDEELETFHKMTNPVELELSPDLEALTCQARSGSQA